MKFRAASRMIIGMLFITGILLAGSAHAKCTQKSIKGNWYAQMFFVDTASSEGYWLNCKLKLSSKGNFDTASSRCQFDSGEEFTVAGQLLVSKKCMVEPFTITFYDDASNIVGTSTLNFGIVDKGKSVMHGLGDSGTTEPFVFSAVKG